MKMLEGLSNVEFDSLSVYTSLTLNEPDLVALVDQVSIFQKMNRAKGFTLAASKVVGDHTIIASLVMERPTRHRGNDYPVDFELSLGRIHNHDRAPRRRIRNPAEKMDDLMAVLPLLNPVTQEAHLHCNCHWQLETSRWLPVVSLPLLRVTMPGSPFRQVSGVRLTPEDLGRNEFAVLDMGGGVEGRFHVSMGFGMTGPISEATFDEVAEEAERLLHVVVVSVSPKESARDDIAADPK